jgi:hypothetical protein
MATNMTFVDGATVIPADWLNNVNTVVNSGGGSGTVTSVSVVTANGFGGTVATATSTPAITLTTNLTGLLKGNGTAMSAAAAGTDYVAPGGALGTPSSGTLTNCTGLPISTGVSGLGTGVATFLATPSSANLASAVTDETGSGALVFGTSPTITTPTINTPGFNNTNITGIKVPAYHQQGTLSTTTGAVTVDWTAGAMYKQNEPTGTITYTFTAPGVSNVHLQLLI